MANSAAYNNHYRDLDLIEFTHEELVARYRAGDRLTYQQARDAERIIAAEEKNKP